MNKLRIGVIGCGAVSERLHLPSLLARDDIEIAAAVDRNSQRSQLLAGQANARACQTVADALPHIDAAIVALPHPLHSPIAGELLRAGKHVLVEKPMATNVAECTAMIEAASRSGVVLAVGQMRRFCPALVAAKRLLAEGLIGRVEKFATFEGGRFNWPVASDYLFRKETAGGGVLLDTGAHTLDTLLWLFGDVMELEYRDDAYGGVEADCALQLTMTGSGSGQVEVSRTRDLPTVLHVTGSRGRMEIAYQRNELTLEFDGRRLDPCRYVMDHPAFPHLNIWQWMILRQLDDWVSAIRERRPPQVPGEEGRRVVALIERCYAARQLWPLPWVHAT